MSQTTFYRAFEDRYRGSRDVIKERLRAYARFTDTLRTLPGEPVALDLGCGRGEWLELLGENGFRAEGVDLDDGMLAACHERGLAARHADALAALRACPDASLALVSAFHLVEHLPFDLVRELIAEALRALKPGGLLIMETPNPENLTVGATSFYLDPSHLHPLPPGLLGFAADHAGFARHRIVRLQEDPQLHTDAPVGLITVLEGVSPDYAVVAQKTAGPALLATFDAAFDAPLGVTLSALSQRYEQQLAGQHAEIHHILGRMGLEASHTARDLADERAHTVELAKAHAGLALQQQQFAQHGAQLAQQLDELRQQAARQEARLVQAEAYATEMSQRVVDLLASSSWRVTAPMRSAMTLAYRLRNAQREGRLGSAARSRAMRLTRRLGGAVLRRPAMKRAVRAVLRKVPALEARLYKLMLDQSSATPVVLDTQPGELSPRAARVYQQLQQLQNQSKQNQARTSDADSH
jgi:SAM-dependent methyltransferase